jgi:hypothetical protein
VGALKKKERDAQFEVILYRQADVFSFLLATVG